MKNTISTIITAYGMAALAHTCLSGGIFRLPADFMQAIANIFTFSA